MMRLSSAFLAISSVAGLAYPLVRPRSNTLSMNAEQDKIKQQMLEMRQQGMTDEQILEQIATEQLLGTGIEIPKAVPPSLPRAGEADWGFWRQDEKTIYIELAVASDTAAKQVSCEVQVGFLDVRIGHDPLLSGRLAQPVLSDVEWAIDDRADGQRVLCIDLQKRRPDAADVTSAEALFSSLKILGLTNAEVNAPGLISGVGVGDADESSALPPL